MALGSNDRWVIYESSTGQWRWRRTAPNGQIVGASTESYSSRANALANAQRNGYKGS